MADPLYELLSPYFDREAEHANALPSLSDSVTANYLTRLTTLSLGSLTTTEPASLAQSSQSVLRSIQALSKRSHRSVISATDHLSNLSSIIPSLHASSISLKDGLPKLETAASDFAKKYDRSTENAVLDRRKKALLLNRNVDRVGNVLELPTLLSTTIGSASGGAGGVSTTGAAASGYASALDIHAHVKRLKTLYPDSDLVRDVAIQSDAEIQNLITILITGLQSPGLKLAGAMRTIGWLRRVAPDLSSNSIQPAASDLQSRNLGLASQGTDEGSLGALFLVCRFTTLRRTLEALDPLKDLADQESTRRKSLSISKAQGQQERWTGGTQTERYLKRFVEVFREQGFAIISMYKSIFPSALPMPGSKSQDTGLPSTPTRETGPIFSPGKSGKTLNGMNNDVSRAESLDEMPSALATFAPQLVDMMFDTLREYMPNIVERSSRDSILTQVLYCAGSMGRLGADFGMMLAVLEDELAERDDSAKEQEQEWQQVMKKHRVQASRLELLASGVGSARKGSGNLDIRSPPPMSPA